MSFKNTLLNGCKEVHTEAEVPSIGENDHIDLFCTTGAYAGIYFPAHDDDEARLIAHDLLSESDTVYVL